jgi:hypothetical protein
VLPKSASAKSDHLAVNFVRGVCLRPAVLRVDYGVMCRADRIDLEVA